MECIVIESDDEVEFVCSTTLPKKAFVRNSDSEISIDPIEYGTTFTNNVFNNNKENDNKPNNGRTVRPPRRVELIKLDDDDVFRKNAKKLVSNSVSTVSNRNPISPKSHDTEKEILKIKYEEAVISDDSDVEIVQVINRCPKLTKTNRNLQAKFYTGRKIPRPIQTSTPKQINNSLPKQINKCPPKPIQRRIIEQNESSSTTEEIIPKPSISTSDNSSKKKLENVDPLAKLQDVCRKGNLGSLMKQIENKLTKYSTLSPEKLSDASFIELVEKTTQEIELIVANTNLEHSEILNIANKIKMIINELKRGTVIVTKKLNLLNKAFFKCKKRIEQIEEMEVESDDESENVYILLAKYREKASRIYDKICELEEKANHADRQYLQRFTYCGKGPIEIQRALEKYYNTTRKFPNFKCVLKITDKINDDKNLNLSEYEVHETAKQMFTDFCEKLKNRRQLDDYHIMVGYIKEGHKDPAMFDQELRDQLDRNKHLWKLKEKEVIDLYARKQTEQSKKKIDENNKNKKTDDIPIASTSSAIDSGDETIVSDTETDDDRPENTEKRIFSDSEEEMELCSIEDGQRKRKRDSSSSDDDNNKKSNSRQ